VAFEAVHVDVDEAGHDQMPREIEMRSAGGAWTRTRRDLDDHAVLDDERARADDAIGQYQVGAGQHRPASGVMRVGHGQSECA
jgi:hypothetical protein